MDISKLPKFSQTRPEDAPEPVMDTSAPPPDPNRPPVPAYASPVIAGDERARRRAEPSLDDELDRGDATVQIWISGIFGIIFLMMGIEFGKFLMSRMSGHTYMTTATWQAGPKVGEPVAYTEFIKYYHPTVPGKTMEAWWDDSAYFFFGLALLFEAASLLAIHARVRGSFAVLGLALLVAFVATAFNLVVAIKLMTFNQLPLMSLVAVALGGWIIASEWRLMQVMLYVRAARSDASGAA